MKLKSWTPIELIEFILATNLFVWGAVFLYPGNVFDTPRYKYSAVYAQDWIWGILLIIVGVLLFYLPVERYFRLRRILHVYAWTFWFSITILFCFRAFEDGVQPNDFLFISVFQTVAFCHLTLYNRLVGVK